MDTVEILRRLVAFDTTSRRSNLDLVNWTADYLDGAGARVRLTSDASGEKANILATIGSDEPGGIVLSGHTDVVPVDDQDWASDPFALASRDGRLHGRIRPALLSVGLDHHSTACPGERLGAAYVRCGDYGVVL